MEVLNTLSLEDKRTLVIGSESEKQDVLNNLTEEERIKVSKSSRIEALSQKLLEHLLIKSGESATFEDLSSQAQEFLINHGFKPSAYNKEDFLKETFYFLYLTAFYDAFFDMDQFMDNEVALFSKNNKIPIKALDNDQLSLVSEKDTQNSMSEKEGYPVMINTIEQLIATYEEEKEIFSSLLKTLKDQTLSSLSQGHLKELEQEINVTDNLLKNRNIIWVEKINQALNTEENNTIFVAGGAAHFLGPDNVIDMLKEASFNIKKLHCSEESLIQD